MKAFREFLIQLDGTHAAAFFDAVDKALGRGWRRNRKAEIEANKHMDLRDGEQQFAYYNCDKRGNREPALLAIYRKDKNILYVSNIVPDETFELTYDQYNAILLDFNHTVLRSLKGLSFPVAFGASSDKKT